MPNTNDNFDTYPFKENGDGNPGGGSPTSTQGAELKVTTLTSSDFNDSNKFSFHHNKGTLKFVNIRETIKNTFSTSSFVVPDTHTTKFSVKNDTTLTIHRPLVLRRKSDDRLFTPKNLTSLPFSMSFENVVTTPATSSDYLNSYADITIGNLRTFSGDVHKVKLFTKQQDKQNQEFEKIGEFVLQSKNTLVDESSPTADDPIGIFYSQSVIDNHWVSSSNSTTANNSLIMNAALISGSNRGADNFVEFKTKDRFELEKDEEYILSFSGYFIKGDKVQSDGSVRKSLEIEVLLSGSVVSQTEDTISIGSIGDVGDSSSELFKGNVSGSIPYVYNYVYTHKKSGAKPKAGLVFRVHAGQFHLSNIKFEAVSDQNFNPGFYKTRVPMPIATRRGQRYDFVSEFYDFNNNKAKIEAATSASVLFAGPKQVLADGEDAIFSGSAMIGQSIQMYGVNPAFLRSVGYNGFDKTLAGTGDRDGGFLLWSGSVGSAIGASETYNGVGIEIVQKGANPHQNSFLQFASDYKGTGQSRFRVQTDEFLLGRSGSGVAGDAYISGSNGNLEISSSNFLVSASGDVVMQGTITAAAGGTIGGFEIGTNDIFSGNSTLSNSNVKLVLGNTDGTPKLALGNNAGTADNITLTGGSDGVFMDGGGDFRVGDADGNRISFDQSTGLLIISSSNFFLGSKANGKSFISSSAGGELEISSSFFHLSSSGHITGSKVLFDGGVIGGFTITDTELKSGTDIILDSSNKKITLDNGSLVIDNNSGTPVIRSATNFASGDGFFLSSATSNNFRVGDAGAARIQFTGTNTEIYNSSDTKLVSLGATNEIAGWTINSSTIASNNLILNSAGIVETSDYTSGVKGFRLSAQDNGFLEVENAKIRGTLRTTVFEKESVNAVGGQLQVGNATVITGSTQISATATQIPVENVSGFTGSEIIMAKKVTGSGFVTEYMLITSQSRRDRTSNTDFSGSLFVVRGYSGSASQSQVTSSLGDSPITASTTLEPGQVLVSTGFYNATTRKGSGYIRLNANPNDSATPFMDIVERTGSAIYDVDLKVRLGDLSGLSSGLVGSNPGFGLFTNKVFLQGNDPTSASIALGSTPPTSVNYTSNAGIYMDGSGDFLVRGDNDNFIKFDVSDKLSIAAEDFELDAGGLKLIGNSSTAANNQIRVGSATALNTGDGVFMNGSGHFRAGDADGHRLEFDGTNIVVSASDFFLGSKGSSNSFISSSGNTLVISSSNFHISKEGAVTASNALISGKVTADEGEIAGWDIVGNTIKKLSGNAGVILDSGKSQIIASGSISGVSTGNGVIIDGVNGILQVSQSGTTIFESGINTQFRLIPDFFVKSQPTALVADSRLAATPLTLVTDISASKKTVGGISGIGGRISVHQAFVEEGFRMTTADPGTSFLYNASRTIDGANEDVPVPVIFDDQRTVNIAENADYMHQSYVFNTNYIADDSADAIRFVGNGATTGSATFQIQATLTDTSDNNFTDAKLNLLGLDVDTSTLPTARQNEYTFLQARHSSSIRAQLQHDGDFVSAGNLTAFGTSFLQVSDERLKQNIYTISQSLDKILDLRPTKYVWKKNKKQDVGFIAQEVEKIIPEVVEESRGFINDDSQIENMKTISYPKLIPYLVDTIQVLVKRIEDLEERFVKK